MPKEWTPEARAEFGRKMQEGRERKRAEREAAGGTPLDGSSPADTATPATEPTPERRKGLFGPGKPRAPRTPRPPGKAPADITDGLEVVVTSFGGYLAEPKNGTGFYDPGVGRSIVFTAPTSARLIGSGVKRFPALHAFLAIFLGAGQGLQEAQAAFGIPLLVGRMERHPETIPSTLPVIRAYMRPVLRDLLRKAKEERKVREELASLERELGDETGAPVSLDEMILVELLGLPQEFAARILSGQLDAEGLRQWGEEARAAAQAQQAWPEGEGEEA